MIVKPTTDVSREVCGEVLLIRRSGKCYCAIWNGEDWDGVDGAGFYQDDSCPDRYGIVGFIPIDQISEMIANTCPEKPDVSE